MTDSCIDGLRLVSTSYQIGFPWNEWSESKSYIVCRALVDQGVIAGTATIGTRRKMVKERINPGDRGIYQITETQYGWIALNGGGVLDPCGFLGKPLFGAEPQFCILENDECYIRGINPVQCPRSHLPEHLVSDELFPLTRGVMRDTCSRLLGYRLHIQGLTMSEAAYLLSRPLTDFDRYSRLVYEYFIKMGLSSMMPLSNIKLLHPNLARKGWRSFYNDLDMDELNVFLK
ncbi:Uncharacterised protein [Escherichia coli]|uniref:hypothetical protein n=1 Tax=Enterobacter mori TaxID=539813 RepID=UPI001A4E0840|nr:MULTISPECIES: hypothetical protein [Enterobacteriaceae]VVY57145.1 Uncharacterised protein [Escherichia coli]VVZ64425.1 Uncharacterised protein [Escherichia coli]VWN03789.1 Uncharacterised protein [Escherichia coli]